jgi:hypothetical protein
MNLRYVGIKCLCRRAIVRPTFRGGLLPPHPLGPTNLFTLIFLAIESCPYWVSARTEEKLQPERLFYCLTEGRQVDVWGLLTFQIYELHIAIMLVF